MTRTLLVCGHGPGISHAVARRFGAEGFQLALVARSADRLHAAAAELTAAGLTARAFPCDLGAPDAVRGLVREVRGALGPITALHWNAYAGGAGDLTRAPLDELRGALDVSLFGLVVAVQEALPDLRAAQGAVLVTGGGFAYYDPSIDAAAVQWDAMGLAIAKAAQHKATGLLHAKLAGEGVYVGEIVVLGTVRGTAFDQGAPNALEPAAIGERFWQLHESRAKATVTFP